MDPKELRIGNFLTYERQICRTKTIILSIANAGVCLGTAITNSNDTLYIKNYEDCIPILLNENWLNVFNFVKEDGTWRNGVVTISLENESYNFNGLKRGKVLISYVHELQNLSFVLNKTELKVHSELDSL